MIFLRLAIGELVGVVFTVYYTLTVFNKLQALSTLEMTVFYHRRCSGSRRRVNQPLRGRHKREDTSSLEPRFLYLRLGIQVYRRRLGKRRKKRNFRQFFCVRSFSGAIFPLFTPAMCHVPQSGCPLGDECRGIYPFGFGYVSFFLYFYGARIRSFSKNALASA